MHQSMLLHIQFKKDAIGNLKNYIEIDSIELGGAVKRHPADEAAGELIERESLDYLDEMEVKYTWSPPDTPEMNSLTERKWRTLNEMARCMLLRSQQLPRDFWLDAYQTAVWLHKNFKWLNDPI